MIVKMAKYYHVSINIYAKMLVLKFGELFQNIRTWEYDELHFFRIINQQRQRRMCFLKSLKPLDSMSTDDEQGIIEAPHQKPMNQQQEKGSYLNSMLKAEMPILMNKKDQLLFNLIENLKINNIQLSQLSDKIEYSEQQLRSTYDSFGPFNGQKRQLNHKEEVLEQESSETAQDSESSHVDPLVEKIFGKKAYRYHLRLTQDIPSTIYKERNINIPVELLDKNNEKILNANIINLCLGICDANGEWITQNKLGQNIMKGKTQMELYHGDGSFLKVYPRDVSRGFDGGKINFVIYAKPSVLQFTNSNSSLEREVNCNMIEPLVIKDITIKAKKRD